MKDEQMLRTSLFSAAGLVASNSYDGSTIDTKTAGAQGSFYWEARVVVTVLEIDPLCEIDVNVQESDNDSTWQDITKAAFERIYGDAGAGQQYEGLLILSKRMRYLRAHAEVNNGDGVIDVKFLLGRGVSSPDTYQWRVDE